MHLLLQDQSHPHKIYPLEILLYLPIQQLIWDLPPIDSIRVNSAIYGLSAKESNKRIENLGSMLELTNELTVPVRKLSLGQRMKVEILAALIHRPSILFLDEPTLGLDINAQLRVREFLKQYNISYGATILLTSHYMGDIKYLCKRVMLIHHGQLIHDGSIESLTKRLAPFKSIKIVFAKDIELSLFAKYGEVIGEGHNYVQLLVSRDSLTSTIAEILNNFNVNDLEIADPPIEELIGNYFRVNKSFN